MGDIAALKEQDLNAQQMQPRHFERLTENIRGRGMIESLPYCRWPREQGTISIISGHHRPGRPGRRPYVYPRPGGHQADATLGDPG